MITKQTSLAKKLFLGAGLLLFVVLLAPWLYMDYNVGETMREEGEARARLQLELVFEMIQQSPKLTALRIKDTLGRFVSLSKSNVTWLSDKGQVLEDFVFSPEMVKVSGNMNYWPEVRQAMDGEVGVSARRAPLQHDRDIFYAAKILPGKDGQDTIIRVGVLASEANADLKRLEKSSILINAIIFALAMLAAYIMSRRFAMSVYKLAETAMTIGHGHFDMRIKDYPGQEFSGLAEAINTMAANISTQMKTISERNRQLQATLDGLWEGVMSLDRNGKIQAFNQAFRKMAGYSDEEIIGRRPIEVILDADLQDSCRSVLAYPENYAGKPKTIDMRIEEESYAVHIVPWYNEEAVGGVIVVFNDISRVKRLEQIRQDFLSNVTHELRTPLTSIKGYAETLAGDIPEDDPKKHSAEIILKNADHMIRMIEGALILSGLESGTQVLDPSSFNVGDLLEEIWQGCLPLAEKRGVSAVFRIDPGPFEAALVTADRDKLQQIFRNIMENAIKYSPAGGVIEAEALFEDGQVTISILDNGPGIPLRDRRRIFERFYRVEHMHYGRDYDLRGSGLGLSISKHIIDMHKGKIWVESPPPGRDHGSVFRVRLYLPSQEA